MLSPPIYAVATEFGRLAASIGGRIPDARYLQQDWWTHEVMTEEVFEQGRHTLVGGGENLRKKYTSDDCPDLDHVDPSIWAFSEKTWDWLSSLEATGARVAPNVAVDGKKRFKLVFPGPVIDLLDHDLSEIDYNDGAPSVVWKHFLYEWEAVPPPMFRIWMHGSKKSGSSMHCFVSQDFVDAYRRRNLTGVEFKLIERSPRPLGALGPFDPIIYWPKHAPPFRRQV